MVNRLVYNTDRTGSAEQLALVVRTHGEDSSFYSQYHLRRADSLQKETFGRRKGRNETQQDSPEHDSSMRPNRHPPRAAGTREGGTWAWPLSWYLQKAGSGTVR